MNGVRTSIRGTSALLGGLAVLLFGLSVHPAFAGDVNSTLFPGVRNQWSDDSGEVLLNCTAGADCSASPGAPSGANTVLDVGDKLVGVIGMLTNENLDGGGPKNFYGPGNPANNELTGVFSLQLLTKTTGGGCPSTFCFTFGPSSTFATDIQTACGGTCTLPAGVTGAPAGTVVALFDDPANNFSRLNPGGRAGNLASAYGGSLYSYFGFAGTAGEFWISNSPTDDISVLKTSPPPGPGGQFFGGITRLPGGIMVPLDTVACGVPGGPTNPLNLCINGQLTAVGGTDTDWNSWDDTNAVFRPASAVPEPTSLLLMGSGLAGFGLWSLRRNRSAKAK